MFDLARDIIGTQPILAIFLAIGVGYLVGQINLGGFSLGVGAVLFVGLAHRRIRAESQDRRTDRPDRPGHVSLRDRNSVRPAVLRGDGGRCGDKGQCSCARRRGWPALWWRSHWDRRSASRSDIRSASSPGSMTSTATLQAALDTMKNSEPSIGYSIAYPFGVIGPILCIYFMTRQVQPKFPAEGGAIPHG